MKIEGVKHDVLQLQGIHRKKDGIVLSKHNHYYTEVVDGHWGYDSGDAFRFVCKFTTVYRDLSDRQATETFARRYLPNWMESYDKTIVTPSAETESSALDMERTSAEPQIKRAKSRNDGWER